MTVNVLFVLSELQKRSGEDVVLLEGYEVSPKDEERDSDCVEYEATSPVPTPAAQTTTRKKVPYIVTPVPTPKKTSKNQLCWVYYGKTVKLYLPMRYLPTLPNPQGNKQIFGPYTGEINGSQPRVVCGKLQRSMGSFPKVLRDYANGRQQDIKGSRSVKPIVVRPAMAIQVSSSRSSSFYNLLRSYQRVLAVQRPGGSSVSSRCV